MANSVWTMIIALEREGHHPGTLAALRFVPIHRQPPTQTGCCPPCRRSPLEPAMAPPTVPLRGLAAGRQ